VQPAPDADRTLAETGAELATRVAAAVPGWVVRCVGAVLDAWGAPPGPPTLGAAEEAGRRAGEEVLGQLAALAAADVDAQHSTPLEIVRRAVSYPTGVLRDAGVPPVVRDRFAEERFPDDDYGLTPASLVAVDPALGDLALAWGAAKAMAHRARHGGARPPGGGGNG